MRERLLCWSDELGVNGAAAFDMVIACSEAFNNAVQYPIDPDREAVDVSAEVIDHAIVVAVRDYGRWEDVEPSPDRDHHGYPLMRALMDSVDVDRTGTGTLVILRRHLPISLQALRTDRSGIPLPAAASEATTQAEYRGREPGWSPIA